MKQVLLSRFVAGLSTLALIAALVVAPASYAASATVTLTPSTLTTTGVTTANDVVVAYTTAGVFSNGDTITVTLKNSAGTVISTSDTIGGVAATLAAASTGADTQATNAADGSFAYGTGTATYTISSAGAATAVSLSIAVPRLEAGVYTINIAENRAYSSAPETYGASTLVAKANVVGATLAFVQSTPATITDSGSNFINNGFKAGQAITVSGATTAGNDGTYIIQAVAAGTLTLQSGATLAAAEAGAAGTVVAASTGPNDVRVTATVEPILAMALSNNAVDLGTIIPGTITDSSTDTTITMNTNANSGYVVQAAATTVTGTNTAATVPFTSRSVMAGAATTSGFSIDVASVVNGTGAGTPAATAGTGAASTYAVANGAATLASSGGPGATDQVVVNYAMTVSAVQPADNYATTVTYTTTASF